MNHWMTDDNSYQEPTGSDYPETSRDTEYLAHAKAAFGFSRLPGDTPLEPASRPASCVTFQRYSDDEICDIELAAAEADHQRAMERKKRAIANS